MRLFKNGKFRVLMALLALIFVAGACTGPGGPSDDSAQGQSQDESEKIAQAARDAVPYPLEEMRASAWLERMNLKERLLRYADANKISYIYLMSEQGQLMGNYTVKGKVSNTSSQMTTNTQIIDGCGRDEYCAFGFDSPMDDGTWGPSEDAIFFYTTEGVMIQWNGPYVLADAPLDMTSTPVLVYNTSSEPTSVVNEETFGGNN